MTSSLISASAPSSSYLQKEVSLRAVLARNRFPELLQKEILLFARRNVLAEIGSSRGCVHECCLQCLKAYLMVSLKKQGAHAKMNVIDRVLPCEAGHGGYYLDNDGIFRVEV